MRKKIAAGNWKMNTSIEEGVGLAVKIHEFTGQTELNNTKVIIAPPYLHLQPVITAIGDSKVSVAAQNCAAWEKGAYTGEISAGMLKSIGTEYVIIGHSERRIYLNEPHPQLLNKVKLSLSNNLTPIFCIGEKLKEREENEHFDIISDQLSTTVFNLDKDSFGKIIIAYEPVWAIGTGVNATPEQAQEIHNYIRELISKKYSGEVAQNITILYGGSCNAANAAELFNQPDVDGGLIGGASLNAESFIGIIKALNSV